VQLGSFSHALVLIITLHTAASSRVRFCSLIAAACACHACRAFVIHREPQCRCTCTGIQARTSHATHADHVGLDCFFSSRVCVCVCVCVCRVWDGHVGRNRSSDTQSNRHAKSGHWSVCLNQGSGHWPADSGRGCTGEGGACPVRQQPRVPAMRVSNVSNPNLALSPIM
jgi:hypothetical protein